MSNQKTSTRCAELEADIKSHLEMLAKNSHSRWYDQSKRALEEKIRELAELKGLN